MHPTSGSSGSARRSLHRNQSGAIAVLGFFLGLVLVAALFHIAMSGLAIVGRELAQDAADNAAYEAAVWNARGMNVIVALNIFMAIVMAVLITWRMALFFLMGLGVISGLACAASALPGMQFLSVACNVVPTATRASLQMIQQDTRIAGRVYRIIDMLHDGQKVVAAATPVLGTLQSARKTTAAFDVDFGIGFGLQLLPIAALTAKVDPRNEMYRRECGGNAKWNSDKSNRFGLLGRPISLPVEPAEDLFTLCMKGGETQAKILMGVLGEVGSKMGLQFMKDLSAGDGPWSQVWGFVSGFMGDSFCGDLLSFLPNVGEGYTNRVCGGRPNEDACRANMGKMADAKNAPDKLKIDPEAARWARIWIAASNGGLFMQSWGLVRKKPRVLDGFVHAVRLPDLFGDRDVDMEPEKTQTVMAQAEMFFDCDDTWLECSFSAPWTMNWRARLRRLHDPEAYVRSAAEQDFVGDFYALLQIGFTTALGAAQFIPVLEHIKLQGTLVPERSKDVPATSAAIPVEGSAADWVNAQLESGVSPLVH